MSRNALLLCVTAGKHVPKRRPACCCLLQYQMQCISVLSHLICHLSLMSWFPAGEHYRGGQPAAASYKAYLSSDAAAGRADGYGLREWRHDPSGALWSMSGMHLSWLAVCKQHIAYTAGCCQCGHEWVASVLSLPKRNVVCSHQGRWRLLGCY
jgi:hypothetical protein